MERFEDYMYKLINDLEVSQSYTGKKIYGKGFIFAYGRGNAS